MTTTTRPTFTICAAQDLDQVAGVCAPTAVVSLLPDADADRLAVAWGANRLALDIPDRNGQGDHPWAIKAARALLAFGATLSADDRVLVHCAAGVSRSPAAALLMDIGWLVAQGYAVDDALVAGAVDRLRAVRPTSYPNGSLLDAADSLLAARGAVSRAREAFARVVW
jgi:predicted protein tyrosine phosphatase